MVLGACCAAMKGKVARAVVALCLCVGLAAGVVPGPCKRVRPAMVQPAYQAAGATGSSTEPQTGGLQVFMRAFLKAQADELKWEVNQIKRLTRGIITEEPRWVEEKHEPALSAGTPTKARFATGTRSSWQRNPRHCWSPRPSRSWRARPSDTCLGRVGG
jgi:hypothetical protein